ncbi:MAG: hypothetical protein ACR2GR_00550 [Rhodothermales bacterium]
MLNFLLNKGGAGVSMTRQDTIDRINPIIEAYVRLNHAYEDTLRRLPNREMVGQLEAFQKIARVDVGKLNETVFSAGGVAYNGTDVEPGSVTLEETENDEDLLSALEDQEAAFQDQIGPEFDLKPGHHIRTQAVLSIIRSNSQSRLDYIRGLTKRRRRTSRIEPEPRTTPRTEPQATPRTSQPEAPSALPEIAGTEPPKIGDRK